MKLAEALRIIHTPVDAGWQPLRLTLMSGFTPLHLQSFLTAHLRLRFPERRITVANGLYGDLAGSLERAAAEVYDAAAVIIEWSDLDPRLGVRSTGGWSPKKRSDIVDSADRAAERLWHAIEGLSVSCPAVICLPTLPRVPASHVPGWQMSVLDAELDRIVATFAARAAAHPRIRLVHRQRLDDMSPPANRLDARSELAAGFPYRLGHADIVAQLLAAVIENRSPKKGVITDLDDTLWDGLLGEVGIDGLSWTSGAGQLHGLYQQLIASLAETGVLVGVASKNDANLADAALRRADLLLSAEMIFPLLVNWGPKSLSVRRILEAWNVGADSVVFIDDNPMEIAEVRAAYPGMECRLFPKNDPPGVIALLNDLRDLFGKASISEEDRLRSASLRSNAIFNNAIGERGNGTSDEFLAGLSALITFDFRKDPADSRPLELINKTNQFNINGRRLTEADWYRHLSGADSFLLRVSYQDKFSALGNIAILAGRVANDTVDVDHWVMSCRAFSRRIEYQCMRTLFRRFGVSRISLSYLRTPRNEPLQQFLDEFGVSPDGPSQKALVVRAHFEAKCPTLHHDVRFVDANPTIS
jgi:FkbH-like protein